MPRFTPQHRIRSKRDFDRVYQGGRKCVRPFLVLHVLAGGQPPEAPPVDQPPRLGLSVSRRVGGAVVRNRVKRRIREIFRLAAEHLPAGCLFVVTARPESATATYRQLEADLIAAWKRNGFDVPSRYPAA